MKVEQMKPFGVRITDIDVNNADHLAQLPPLLYTHGIILMPKGAAVAGTPSTNSAEGMTKMGVKFGRPLMTHNIDKFVEEGKPVVELATGGVEGVAPDSYFFHSDVSWWETPSAVALLTCVQNPSCGGGNTLFQNAHEMYRRLSPESRDFLASNRFVHSFHHAYIIGDRPDVAEQKPEERRVQHGIIRHPVKGQPLVYVSKSSTMAVEGKSKEESAPLLDKVFAEVYDKDLTYTHVWEEGDLVIWDNFGVQHKANNDYDKLRIMHKITLLGDYVGLKKYNADDDKKNTPTSVDTAAAPSIQVA